MLIRTFLLFLLLLAPVCADPAAAIQSARAGEEALESSQYAKAVEAFTRAITEDDTNPSFYGNRASAYSYLGKLEEALADYETAIQKTVSLSGDPKDKRLASIYYNRGYAYERAGQFKEAVGEYEKAIEVNPAYPDAHGNAAWILATNDDPAIRNPRKALEYALVENIRTKSISAAALDTLAAAYAANGQFKEARTHQKQAVSKAKNPQDKREFADRLKLYELNEPYVEPAP